MKATTYNIITLFSLLTLFLVSTSCTDELATATGRTTDNQTPRFVISTNSPQTRVSYGSITHSTFEEGDVLGAFVLDQDGNIVINSSANITYSNIQYQVVGNASDGAQTLQPVLAQDALPYGDDTYRYIFYYPFREGTTYNNVTHTVQTDQTTSRLYELSDLLWDVVTVTPGTDNAPTVEVAMDHAMANIVLNIDRSYLSSGNDGYEVYILNTPYMADGINLSQALDNENRSYTVDNEHTTDIRMWCSNNEAQTETLQFRAVIPACQTISSGSPFLRITAADGTQKRFSLKENLTLLSGRNYIFTVTENEEPTPIIPDVTDDDSWVFDVLDPETNEPIGLLCREYLRYQPGHTDNNTEDEETGTTVGDGTYYVSSQAWVFYNLQPNSNIPDLNTGHVVYVINDVIFNGWALWPAPYQNKSQQGLFTPDHGHSWDSNYQLGYGQTGNVRDGFTAYLHNSTIQWNGNENIIHCFTPPTTFLTNEEARYGHIAIPETGNPFVSYLPFNPNSLRDDEGNKIGVLMPHNLIDNRINENGETEINVYPLVKIGYNQFWISKAMNCKTLTDGTPLTCYNKEGEPGVTFGKDDVLSQAGYMYPYASINDNDGKGIQVYDPYNKPEQMTPEGTTFRPSPVYNKLAVNNDNFLPISQERISTYVMPTMKDIELMNHYFGWRFAGKMCTRAITEFNPTQTANSLYGRFTAILKGETHGPADGYTPQANSYTANISGLNLRAIGYYTTDNGFCNNSASAAIILGTQQAGIDAFIFNAYNPFGVTLDDGNTFWNNQYVDNITQHNKISQFFAQVRLLMKYRNQADTGGSTAFTISSITRSSSSDDTEEKSINHNIYVPIQPAD